MIEKMRKLKQANKSEINILTNKNKSVTKLKEIDNKDDKEINKTKQSK